MKSSLARMALPIAIASSIVACTFGLQAATPSPLDAAATIVAATLRAQGASTSPGAVLTVSPSASPNAATATATTKPTLRINTNDAQCRSGPNSNAKVVASFSAGTTVDMIAKDTADGYWLVKDPASGSSCWVQSGDATPAGSFDLLPEVTPQATVARDVPAKPGSSSSFNYWQYQCGVGSVTVELRWIDSADNENGYRIYRSGELIADLPAGSTSYTDTTAGGTLSYSIRAYNDAGESAPLSTPSFSC